jgi:hypothetical protein
MVWLVLALLVSLFYLVVSRWAFGYLGYPLDDAWIHQTYARNLARAGQFAFVPGQPSAGSTAPLWTVLLSVGYLLGIPFRIWTYGLGIVLLGLCGWTVARLGERLFPGQRAAGLWAGLFTVFEWHMVWAALSGMETVLFAWLSLLLFERYLAGQAAENPGRDRWSDFGLGILGGLLVLTRPEGIGLVGIIGLDIAFRRWYQPDGRPIGDLFKRWLSIAAGMAILLVPYVLFHLLLTGLPFPNTLYAKQTEYGVILETFPVWWRLFGNFGPPVESVQGVFRVVFIGAQLLLLPGLVFAAWLTYRERRWALCPAWLWWIAYLLLYGVQLPVTYQHGRYQIPVIPWLILLGVWGTIRLVRLLSAGGMAWRVAGRVLALSLVILVFVFALVGARAYGRDVRIIESEMVATARWLNDHTPADALVAAHDIGAIGYFAQKPLIDLAGLVTPEVIPIIRDEALLLEFVVARDSDYLVTFPSWYPAMTQDPRLIRIHSTDAPWAPLAGGDNMAIFQITSAVKR